MVYYSIWHCIQVHYFFQLELQSAKDEENTYIYELYAVVSHIREAKTGGHLVSHLKGGEAYHLRKEQVTCTQWYLINDFSIAPVEKVGGYRQIHINFLPPIASFWSPSVFRFFVFLF